MEIVEFLLACIAEDERAAGHANWAMQGEWFTTADNQVDAFVQRVSPARVLADCAAKRRIVEQARDYSPELEHGDNGEWAFDLVLSALVTAYADRPGFDPAWFGVSPTR